MIEEIAGIQFHLFIAASYVAARSLCKYIYSIDIQINSKIW